MQYLVRHEHKRGELEIMGVKKAFDKGRLHLCFGENDAKQMTIKTF
jgi:hypothetical protein